MKNIIEPSAQSKEVKPLPEITLPTLEELLQAGSHFGHRTSAWNPKMKPFIYGQRNDVHIIDLIKTLKATKVALEAIQKSASEGYILVVGTKGQAVTMVMQMALQKGAFYINKRWPKQTSFAFISIALYSFDFSPNIYCTNARLVNAYLLSNSC